ncbi:vegetative cell wall protein gp1-like [Helianthus annuus]|uniref:vegetative cell wall protein gp1-like n=1 Tax=Helianthus annuus TaxID=4232 RepID=UPI001652E38B|nr:vegetative cell wall protein gp1-like [Helianthus annuus]
MVYMPLDVVADDDVDLFEEDPLEDDLEGEAHIAAGDLLLLADAPTEEAPIHSPVPDSFESVASAPSHAQGVQHHSHDTDPDMASSAAPAPAPSFEFGHDIDDDSDPVFPPGFDPDHDIEFIHLDQPMEDPVAPVDPMFADPTDFDMEFDDPEPADDHAINAPHIADIPAAPLVAPLPDPVPVEPDHAPFATHVNPRYAHTRNGWIDNDDDYPPFVVPVTPISAPASVPIDAPLFPTLTTDAHRTDLPITFLQDIPPPRPGEGSSRQPFGQIPFMTGGDQFVPQISHHTAVPPVAPFTMPSFAPSSEPFLWTSPPIMPPSDPYHPYHMGSSAEDILSMRCYMKMPPRRQTHMPTNKAELQQVIAVAIAQNAASLGGTSGSNSNNNGNNNPPHGNIKLLRHTTIHLDISSEFANAIRIL